MTNQELCNELNKTSKQHYKFEPFTLSGDSQYRILVYPKSENVNLPPEFIIQSEMKAKEHGRELIVQYFNELCFDSLSVKEYLRRINYKENKMSISDLANQLNQEVKEKFKLTTSFSHSNGKIIYLNHDDKLPIDYIVEAGKKIKENDFDFRIHMGLFENIPLENIPLEEYLTKREEKKMSILDLVNKLNQKFNNTFTFGRNIVFLSNHSEITMSVDEIKEIDKEVRNAGFEFLISIGHKTLPLHKYLVERKSRDLNNLLTSLNEKHKVFHSEKDIVWIPTIYANFNAGYLSNLEKQVKDAGFELQIAKQPIKKHLLSDFCDKLNKDFKSYMEIFRCLDFKKSESCFCSPFYDTTIFIHSSVLEKYLAIDQIQSILNHVGRKVKDNGYTMCVSYQGKEYTKEDYLKIKEETVVGNMVNLSESMVKKGGQGGTKNSEIQKLVDKLNQDATANCMGTRFRVRKFSAYDVIDMYRIDEHAFFHKFHILDASNEVRRNGLILNIIEDNKVYSPDKFLQSGLSCISNWEPSNVIESTTVGFPTKFASAVSEIYKYESTNPQVDQSGNKRWFNSKGQLHRLDGPACEYANGNKYWYKEGKHHRLDGPAIEFANGDKSWFIEGNLHRLDGPAIEHANGSKYWYIEGKEYTEEEFLKMTEVPSSESIKQIANEPLKLDIGRGIGLVNADISETLSESDLARGRFQIVANLNKEVGPYFSILPGYGIGISGEFKYHHIFKAKPILDKKGTNLFVKEDDAIYYVTEYLQKQLLALKGKDGIIDITDIDNPLGITVKIVKWLRFYSQEWDLNNLGYQIKTLERSGILKSFWNFPKQFCEEYFPLLMPIPIITVLILMALPYPTSLSSKVIHQGVLEKIDGKKYVFKDGSSFVLETDKISGIIPKGVEVELKQDIWGKYRFEKKQ